MYANASTAGTGSVAVAIGLGSNARAGEGGAIVLVGGRRNIGMIVSIFASKVGENGIEANKWYQLDDKGQPIEVSQ
jgi:hypothetical protein